jgi:hypothetical protein
MYVKLGPFKKFRRIGAAEKCPGCWVCELSIPALAYMRMDI